MQARGGGDGAGGGGEARPQRHAPLPDHRQPRARGQGKQYLVSQSADSVVISTPLQWVLNGRIIQNNSAPLHSRDPDQVYVIEDLALAEGSLSSHVTCSLGLK